MKLRHALGLLLGFALLLPTILAAHAASLAQQLRGSSWKLVSVTIELPNGNKVQPEGPNPVGMALFDRTGHAMVDARRPDVPKFASNNFRDATEAELAAAGRAGILTFGTYTVDDKTNTLIMHIISSSFPNWNGTDLKDITEIKGDTMTWENLVGAQQSPTVFVWKRYH